MSSGRSFQEARRIFLFSLLLVQNTKPSFQSYATDRASACAAGSWSRSIKFFVNVGGVAVPALRALHLSSRRAPRKMHNFGPEAETFFVQFFT